MQLVSSRTLSPGLKPVICAYCGKIVKFKRVRVSGEKHHHHYTGQSQSLAEPLLCLLSSFCLFLSHFPALQQTSPPGLGQALTAALDSCPSSVGVSEGG